MRSYEVQTTCERKLNTPMAPGVIAFQQPKYEVRVESVYMRRLRCLGLSGPVGTIYACIDRYKSHAIS